MKPIAGFILASFLLACGISERSEPPPALLPEASVSETVPPASVVDAAPPAEITDAAAPPPEAAPPATPDAGTPPQDNGAADFQTCVDDCARDVKCIFDCMRRLAPGGF
jgi:hypothetical protein